jgi:hypothetical protein
MENGTQKNSVTATNTNEREHSSFRLESILSDIKDHLGIILVAEAGHGKSYTAFSLVKEAMRDPNLTVIVLSPSTIWRRKFGAIDCLKVGTSTFNPIVPTEQTSIESVPFLRDTVHVNLDKKYNYVRSAWFEVLLRSKQHLLFEIKYKNGRRIKYFEAEVLKYIYNMQEREIDANPEYAHHYLIVLEEIQNAFGTYSMNADDSLELMTVFTQSRSDAQIHYLAIGQRLNDISTKVVERLRPFIGLTLGENSLRKLKAMLPDDLKDRIQQLPKRHWIYLDGKLNPEIEIAEYKAEGKITFLKPKFLEQKTETPTRKENPITTFFKGIGVIVMAPFAFALGHNKPRIRSHLVPNVDSDVERELREEDSQADGLMTMDPDDDIMFPEEF